MSDCLHGSCKHGQRDDVQTQGQQSSKDREELIDDLADCLAQLQDDSDIERINRILEEIEQLEPTASDFDAEQSLARFHEKHEDMFSAERPAAKVKKPKRRKPVRYIARTAAIIAALLIVFIGVTQAAGFDIMRIFPWWNEEWFHFSQEGDDIPEEMDSFPEKEFGSLQAALDNYGVQIPLAPTQLPGGAELQSLAVRNMEDQLMFHAEYALPDGELFITIVQLAEIPHLEVEKDTADAEIYTVDGIEHLIMDDMGMQKAVWYHGVWEGMITGNVSRDELAAMIDSIYQ